MTKKQIEEKQEKDLKKYYDMFPKNKWVTIAEIKKEIGTNDSYQFISAKLRLLKNIGYEIDKKIIGTGKIVTRYRDITPNRNLQLLEYGRIIDEVLEPYQTEVTETYYFIK